ncbi:hypothetical protein LRS03_01105 [Rhizobacter sp. J219]|uniref:hypothetical protein n=1 Tax=Rhizobacter sp. J219 TaxID=2898430 RepID=UPI0021509777|nr:hypothetical protein [Rhizobacter sp. J219]MCR5881539.1 hypothetical protein [Rhizobacter sp. J219]
MPYSPNFSDPRTRRRVRSALAWSWLYLTPTRARRVPKETLDAVFGPSGNKQAKFIRDALLVKQPWWDPDDFGEVKRYRLNDDGARALASAIELPADSGDSIPQHVREHLDTVYPALASLQFEYVDHAPGRLTHGLQNLRREVKPVLWRTFGLPYDYDIVACSANVLVQLAKRAGMKHVPVLDEYLEDRAAWRERFAKIAGVEVEIAKKAITSIFTGALVAENEDSSIFHMVHRRAGAVAALRDDPDFSRLFAGVNSMWRWLRIAEGTQHRRSLVDLLEGHHGTRPTGYRTGRQKYALYVRHERQVIDAVHAHLNKTGNRHFLEHDGWRTERPIDVERMREVIRDRTGFTLQIEARSLVSTGDLAVRAN